MTKEHKATRASVAIAAVALASNLMSGQAPFRPAIPKAWDSDALASLDVPLAGLGRSPLHQASEVYYKRPIYQLPKSYPAYHPDREPAGYLDWLRQQEPEFLSLDFARLETEADWVRVGELLFTGARRVNEISVTDLRDRSWFAQTGVKPAADGTVPGFRYFVRRKGEVVVSAARCATCHTRVLPDGRVVVGAQGNNPTTFLQGYYLQRELQSQTRSGAPSASSVNGPPPQDPRASAFRDFSVPWITPDPAEPLRQMTLSDLASAYMAVPAGVVARPDTSLMYPPKTPDLIGIKDRRYLDATGLVQHRSIGDLMRYIALIEGTYLNDRYGEHGSVYGLPADAASLPRFSDEELFALALYVYSLEPPANPNRPDAVSQRGEQVFRRAGCGTCHTPPLYTSNTLTPAIGFSPPEDHLRNYSIIPTSVGTDPRLAMQSRKGTGYYRPPSLKGVWYRGPFEHNGSVATLEDWFDPRRFEEDYVPTGFKGFNVTHHAVKGHPFGLQLSSDDKKALIAFLKTL